MGKPTWSGQDFSKKPTKVASVKKIAPGIKDCGSPFHNSQITDSVTQVRRYADGSEGGVKADEPGFFASVRDFFTKERPASGSVSDEVYASKSYQDDKAAGIKASEGEKISFWERLKAGNIDDPNSEAYRRFGAGRAVADRDEQSRKDEYAVLNRADRAAASGGSSASSTSAEAVSPARKAYEESVDADDQRMGRSMQENIQRANTGIMKDEKGREISSEDGSLVNVSSASSQAASAPARASAGSSGASARPASRATNTNTAPASAPARSSTSTSAARGGNSRSNLDTDSIQTMANQLIDLNKRIADPATPAQAKAQFEAARARLQAAMRDRAAAGK